MNEERIAALVVEYLLATAGGMIDQRNVSDSRDERKSQRQETSTKGDKDQLDKVFKQFEAKLFGMLAPAALVATMLSSAASGLSVFIGAVKILGSTLGMLLAPGIMLLSAVILTVSDVIQSALLPNLEDWYTAVITFGLGAIDFLETQFINAANTIIDFVAAVTKAAADVYGIAATLMITKAMIQQAYGDIDGARKSVTAGIGLIRKSVEMENSKQTDKMSKTILDRLGIMTDENGKPIPLSSTGGFGDQVKKNLLKVTQEFRQENLPKAQQTGLSQAYFSAQMATLNLTPFERENLKILMIIADTMDKVAQKVQPPTSQ